MEARIRRPSLGVAALCATLGFISAQHFTAKVASAQSGRPAVYGAQSGMGGSAAMQPPFIQGRGAPGRGPMRGATPRGGMQGAGQSENFIVLCNDPELTQTVSQEAERLRRELAVHWLGEELPNWSRRCPIHVTSGANLGAGGETRFSLYNGNVGEWNMSVQGTPERILDSVLPHEITHTLFASHFAPLNVHVPRWADEGACTTVEHSSEQNKHKTHLLQYLSTGRGLSFNRMFSLKDYPNDILPLYAQGHSVVEFLIAQGGARKFVAFLEEGMQSQRWESAIKHQYEYETLGQLQTKWNQWIAEGRGSVDEYVANPGSASVAGTLASNARPASVPSLDAAPSAAAHDNVLEGSSVELVSLAASTSQLAATNVGSKTQSTTAAADGSDGGFYRQRLESKLRDIVRVTPGETTARAPEQPAARTASLNGNSSISIEPATQRSNSRPQPSQPTPTRILQAGNQPVLR